jgi:hypothetical protein
VRADFRPLRHNGKPDACQDVRRRQAMTINPYEPSRTPQPLATTPIVPPEGPIDIEFDLTMDDFVEFNLDHSNRSMEQVNKGIFGCVGVLGAISVPVGVAIYFLRADFVDVEGQIFLTIWAVVNFVVLIALVVWLLLRKRPLMIRGDFLNRPLIRYLLTRGDTSTLTGRYWLRLDRSEILERAPKSEHRIYLSAVQKIVLSPKHLYLYISPMQAVLIPLRDFADEFAIESFVAAAQQRTGVKAIRG